MILETALMITVLLVLTFGIVDFGRVMYTSNSLISAAREGARWGAVRSSLPSATLDSIRDTVRARFNSYRFGGDALIRDSVTVTADSTSGHPNSVKVTISYGFTWTTPVARLLRWTTSPNFQSDLHATATYRFENQ